MPKEKSGPHEDFERGEERPGGGGLKIRTAGVFWIFVEDSELHRLHNRDDAGAIHRADNHKSAGSNSFIHSLLFLLAEKNKR